MDSIHLISTLLIALFLLASAYSYFFSVNTISGVRDLGFPDFFRVQLGLLKILAVPILLVPQLPTYVKDWAYAGTGLFLITAIVAHIAHRDSKLILLLLAFLFGVLALSRYSL